jgi:hypothetical protein
MTRTAEAVAIPLDWQIAVLHGQRGWYLRGKVYATPARGRRWVVLDYKAGPFGSRIVAALVLAETRAILGETTEREVVA